MIQGKHCIDISLAQLMFPHLPHCQSSAENNPLLFSAACFPMLVKFYEDKKIIFQSGESTEIKRLHWRRKAVSREFYLFRFRFVATAEPRTRSPAGVLLAPDARRRGCVGGLLFSASVALLPVGKAKIAATEIIQQTWAPFGISISNST